MRCPNFLRLTARDGGNAKGLLGTILALQSSPNPPPSDACIAAACSRLVALPTIGLRTLIESIMRDKVGDKGSFGETLKAFRKAGYITDQHSELIDRVIEAGHASVHRAHFPDESDVTVCIEVVKHLLEGVYILQPKVHAVTKNTPKRK